MGKATHPFYHLLLCSPQPSRRAPQKARAKPGRNDLTIMARFLSEPKHGTRAFQPERRRKAQKPLVLVVEDHEDTCFLLNYLLELRGCRVVEAKDGESAVRLALENVPDLVLMDISLPRLDGLSAVCRMRGTPALRDVPVVFLSGHAEASFRREALKCGDDYLAKPFSLAELERILERYMGRAAASDARSI